jgi:hypothetical protein
MAKTAAQFIEAKGIAALAEASNREPGAIRLWKFRNRIPRDAWPELIQAEIATLEELKATEGLS